MQNIKGDFVFFDVEFYEVLIIHSQYITYSGWQLSRPQFRETLRSTDTEAKQCTAMDKGGVFKRFILVLL